RPAFLALLVINAVAGMGAMIGGLSAPFSDSWAAADYIRANVDPSAVLVAIDDYCASPVAPWLDRDIYFPQTRSFGRWNTQNGAIRLGYEEVQQNLFGEIAQLSDQRNADVLLMLTSGRAAQFPPRFRYQRDALHAPVTIEIESLPTFARGIVADE